MNETELQRLVVRLVGDSASFQKMVHSAVRDTQRAGKDVERAAGRMERGFVAAAKRMGDAFHSAGQRMRQIGRQMSLYVTAPIVAIGALSVRAFSGFNQAMTESTSIMKVTAEQAERMRNVVLELSTSGKGAQGPKELAASYFYLASAGKDAEQSMALMPMVMQFATAGAFDMSKATDLLTDAQSALGMSSRDVVKDTKNMLVISDMLVKANTLANASVEQFSTSLTSKAGSAFKSYNIALNEGIALLAAYADQGMKGELSGESAGRMIRLLTKATADNSDAFRKYNIQVFNAQGEFRRFADIIGDMERAFEGMSTKAKAAALEQLGFEARTQQVILPLLGTSEALGRYSRELAKAGGTTKEVAEKQMKSFSNQMALIKNHITALAIEIGGVLAPYLVKLGGYIKSATGWFTRLTDETKRTILVIAGVAAAVGPTLVIFGLMASSLVNIIRVSSLAGVAIFAITKPMSWLVSGASAVGMAMVGMASAVVTGVSAASAAMLGGVVSAVSVVTSRWRVVPSYLYSVWQSGFIGPVSRSLAAFSAAVPSAFAVIKSAGASAFTALSTYVQAFVRGWTGQIGIVTVKGQMAFHRFGEEARYWLSRPIDYLNAVFPYAMSRATGAVKAASDRIKALWSSVGAVLQSVVSAAGSAWSNTQNYMVAKTQSAWGAIRGYIQSSATSASSFVSRTLSTAFSKIVSPAMVAARQVESVFSAAANRISQFFSPVASRIRATFSPLVPLVRQDAAKIASAFRQAGQFAAAGIRASMLGAFAVIRRGAVVTGLTIRRMGGGLMRLVEGMTSLALMIGSIGGSVGGLGKFAATLAMISPLLLVISPAMMTASAAGSVLVGTLVGVGTALAALATPIGLIAAGAVALGVIMVRLAGGWEKSWITIKQITATSLSAIVRWIWVDTQRITNTFSESWRFIKEDFGRAWSGIRDAVANGDLKAAFNISLQAVKVVWADTWYAMRKTFADFTTSVAETWYMFTRNLKLKLIDLTATAMKTAIQMKAAFEAPKDFLTGKIGVEEFMKTLRGESSMVKMGTSAIDVWAGTMREEAKRVAAGVVEDLEDMNRLDLSKMKKEVDDARNKLGGMLDEQKFKRDADAIKKQFEKDQPKPKMDGVDEFDQRMNEMKKGLKDFDGTKATASIGITGMETIRADSHKAMLAIEEFLNTPAKRELKAPDIEHPKPPPSDQPKVPVDPRQREDAWKSNKDIAAGKAAAVLPPPMDMKPQVEQNMRNFLARSDAESKKPTTRLPEEGEAIRKRFVPGEGMVSRKDSEMPTVERTPRRWSKESGWTDKPIEKPPVTPKHWAKGIGWTDKPPETVTTPRRWSKEAGWNIPMSEAKRVKPQAPPIVNVAAPKPGQPMTVGSMTVKETKIAGPQGKDKIADEQVILLSRIVELLEEQGRKPPEPLGVTNLV